VAFAQHTYYSSILTFPSPPHAPTFSVAVLHQSETEGTRLVGYVEIGRGEVLGSVESNRCRWSPLALNIITENYNVAFQLQFNKVNLDGPSLKFSAGFSVSELPYKGVSGLDGIGMPENTSKFSYILLEYSLNHLQLPLSRVAA
jgi:hypothetical protein